MTTVILGLGSNVGDRVGFLDQAVERLESCGALTNPRRSALYESDALLPENAPEDWDRPYYNTAIRGETKLSPHELLAAIKDIESSLGREEEHLRWSPRTIDIDILAYGDEHIHDSQLTIPHIGLQDRPFALLPLLDVFPEWKQPANFSHPFPFNTRKIADVW